MATNGDFLSTQGTADPELVIALSGISGLTDPQLLARYLDGLAGRSIDFRMFGSRKSILDARSRLRAVVGALRKDAQKFLKDCPTAPDFDLPAFVVEELMHPSGSDKKDIPANALAEASRFIDALEVIADFSLAEGFGKGGRRMVDEGVLSVVHAVARYCADMGIGFTGGPRRVQADGKAHHINKSAASRLTADVLATLGLSIKNSELATYMAKARELAEAN